MELFRAGITRYGLNSTLMEDKRPNRCLTEPALPDLFIKLFSAGNYFSLWKPVRFIACPKWGVSSTGDPIGRWTPVNCVISCQRRIKRSLKTSQTAAA